MLSRIIIRRSIVVNKNYYHSGRKVNKANDSAGGGSLLDADSSKPLTRFYHMSGIALVGLAPLSFILSPSFINIPVDLALGFIFPLHSHIALNYVISDYVPKASRGAARAVLLSATIIAAAGLLKLNIEGPGLTETFKSVWRKKTITKKE